MNSSDNLSLFTDMHFLNIIRQTLAIYLDKGARSSLKVDFLHGQIKSILENGVCKQLNWSVALEQKISSINASGNKKCDIVVFDKDRSPVAIFPVKFIMSNYHQNKNNSWENLTGECCHLKWHSDNMHVKIVPINIIFSQIPYLLADKTIGKFELIEYDKTFRIYDTLVSHQICHDVVNYIIDVIPQNDVGDKYDTPPVILGFNKSTPFRPFDTILRP
jgi:hypothetical protein